MKTAWSFKTVVSGKHTYLVVLRSSSFVWDFQFKAQKSIRLELVLSSTQKYQTKGIQNFS